MNMRGMNDPRPRPTRMLARSVPYVLLHVWGLSFVLQALWWLSRHLSRPEFLPAKRSSRCPSGGCFC